MLTLYGYGKRFGVIDPSPFVVKVDAFLRMAEIEYRVINRANNLQRSPKGKLPFIVIEKDEETQLISDSEQIMEHLRETYNIELDGQLTHEQKALSHLLTKSLDENLYWCLVYSRWADTKTWPYVKQTLFGRLPVHLRWLAPMVVRRKILKALKAQGTGRHSKTEILAIADKSFSALSVLLGSNQYFFGDEVSTFDAVAYAFLAQVISLDYNNDFTEKARGYENLVKFCQRIEYHYY